MRLCIVSETWAPEVNGVACTLLRLAQELTALGITIDLIRPQPSGKLIEAGTQAAPTTSADEVISAEHLARPLALPGYSDVQVGFTRRHHLKRFLIRHQPDVVYLATQGPLGWSARQAARDLDIALIAGWHTNFDRYCTNYGVGFLSRLARGYLRLFHNGCTMTLVPTAQQAAELAADGFHDVQVLSRGIDGDRFTPQERDGALRAAWGVNDHQPVALHVGRLAAEKNLALLIDTFEAMRTIRPDMAFVIVGDGPARAELERALPGAHFTGFIPQCDLPPYYASADLFVFPSLSETWGNVVSEAMACGLAVVAFAHAASATLIDSGVNGISLPINDADGFRDAAIDLCQHPADCARYGRMARQSVLQQSWKGIATTLSDYLHQAQEMHHATSSYRRV